MKNVTVHETWKMTDGSDGNYIAVKNESGKQIARVLWGECDYDRARLIESAPKMARTFIEVLEEIRNINRNAGETLFNPAVTQLVCEIISRVNE